MSRRLRRKELLTREQIDFYCNLEWKAKSKRLREKANKILKYDSDLEKIEYGAEDEIWWSERSIF